MIDSSGRRVIIPNGTILDMLPVGKTIALSGVLLVLLFSFVQPEASHGLGLGSRLLFWALHVGLGLFAIIVASWWLGSRVRLPDGTWPSVLVSGVAGLVVAVAGYLILDIIYAPHIVDLDPDPPAGSLAGGVLVELMELGPWFMASWLLINLPVLLPQPTLQVRLDDEVISAEDASLQGELDGSPKNRMNRNPAPEQSASKNTQARPQAPATQDFLLNLPGVIGTDVVAVSSDLHYLNVWTVAGRTTVLGNLRDAIADLGDSGMQVHRSHWVSHAHVRRIVGTATDAACIMSNELRIPVSRRRWKAVREQYGRGVVHRNPSEMQVGEETGSH